MWGIESPYCGASLDFKIFLIPIDDYLQTFKEFEEVQNSLKFIQEIEKLPTHRSRWDFFISARYVINSINIHYLAKMNIIL